MDGNHYEMEMRSTYPKSRLLLTHASRFKTINDTRYTNGGRDTISPQNIYDDPQHIANRPNGIRESCMAVQTQHADQPHHTFQLIPERDTDILETRQGRNKGKINCLWITIGFLTMLVIMCCISCVILIASPEIVGPNKDMSLVIKSLDDLYKKLNFTNIKLNAVKDLARKNATTIQWIKDNIREIQVVLNSYCADVNETFTKEMHTACVKIKLSAMFGLKKN